MHTHVLPLRCLRRWLTSPGAAADRLVGEAAPCARGSCLIGVALPCWQVRPYAPAAPPGGVLCRCCIGLRVAVGSALGSMHARTGSTGWQEWLQGKLVERHHDTGHVLLLDPWSGVRTLPLKIANSQARFAAGQAGGRGPQSWPHAAAGARGGGAHSPANAGHHRQVSARSGTYFPCNLWLCKAGL